MTTVHLTVNGEPCSADVAGRTQLAELLRDHLHLTGTHLGCEHGVCGACTVLVDGRPIRSCITYAQACEGANVVTVEGLGGDPVGRALGEAFARHHALQCGFCTPGMLIAAWDIVTRLAPTEEAAIRHELSGNLCRCTGYVGIVAAVQDVARRHRGAPLSRADASTAPEIVPAGDATVAAEDATAPGGESSRPRAAPAGGGTVPVAAGDDGRGASAAAPTALAFEPFEVDPIHLVGMEAAGAPGTAAPPMTQAEGWTLVEREFVIGHPVDALWALFEDLPRVAGCLPGVHVDSAEADRFTGRAEIRFGPIAAAFHGEGTRETDAARRTGVISGHGADPRGHATLEAELRYAMSGEESGDSQPRTRVELAIRFRIQGALAQFSRGDLVESFADVVLSDFVRNCERRLAGEEPGRRADPSGFVLLWRLVRARLGF